LPSLLTCFVEVFYCTTPWIHWQKETAFLHIHSSSLKAHHFCIIADRVGHTATFDQIHKSHCHLWDTGVQSFVLISLSSLQPIHLCNRACMQKQIIFVVACLRGHLYLNYSFFRVFSLCWQLSRMGIGCIIYIVPVATLICRL